MFQEREEIDLGFYSYRNAFCVCIDSLSITLFFNEPEPLHSV